MGKKIISVCEYDSNSIYYADSETGNIVELRMRPDISFDRTSFGYLYNKKGEKTLKVYKVGDEYDQRMKEFAKANIQDIIDGSNNLTKEEIIRRAIEKLNLLS